MGELINIDDILAVALNAPGVRIDRDEFLTKNFSRIVKPEKVQEILKTSPIRANISTKKLSDVAKECINYETYKVSLLSVGSGFGGLVGIPADLAQYLVHVIRISQKLAYIYGWPEIINIDEGLDEETKNIIFLFMGEMYGIKSSNELISAVSKTYAQKLSKDLAKSALTKTAWYPILKELCKTVGIKITKDTVAKSAAKAIPVLASIACGTMTYCSFKNGANRLHKSLKENPVL